MCIRDSDGGAVRLGVSMMCPGRQTLSMWTDIHDLEPSLRFEIVPVSDLYDERESVMRSLGREVDVVQSSFSTPRWGDACQKPVSYTHLGAHETGRNLVCRLLLEKKKKKKKKKNVKTQ